jgi:hypothetical protein
VGGTEGAYLGLPVALWTSVSLGDSSRTARSNRNSICVFNDQCSFSMLPVRSGTAVLTAIVIDESAALLVDDGIKRPIYIIS